MASNSPRNCATATSFTRPRSACKARYAWSRHRKTLTNSSRHPGACNMPKVRVRKRVLVIEEIFHEGGPRARKPLRRAASLAVIHNPFAGKYVAEVVEVMEDLNPRGLEMAQSLVAALGGDPRVVEGYGKGAIVGQFGELEH